ncbi:MAG: prepilin-type N-terminal cleavage/methylation domain-containing protein [Verrucomicrobiae bacterium]
MKPRKPNAYSLIEVMIAGAIVAIGIAAAALMANALLMQEEAQGYSLRAFNTQEQAARLWQLRLDGPTITNILPERCSASTNPPAYSMHLQFITNTTNISVGGGPVKITVEMLNPLRIIFNSGTDGSNNPIYRTNEITVVRPTIR